MIALILITLLITTTACNRYSKANALETMTPKVYEENADNGLYFESIRALGDFCPNQNSVDYPSIDHLIYIYI